MSWPPSGVSGLPPRSDLRPAVPLISLGFGLNSLGIGFTSEIPWVSGILRVKGETISDGRELFSEYTRYHNVLIFIFLSHSH